MLCHIHRIFKVRCFLKMITLVFAQLFLVCISLSFTTLTMYHYANAAAQIAMLFHNIFPFKRIRYGASGLLGAAALCSGLAWMISAIRAWRYLFFPSKEGVSFFIECSVNIIVVLMQLVLMVAQGKEVMRKVKVTYLESLFKICVFVLFFHDFAYAAIFTDRTDALFVFGYSQFLVHTLMLGLNRLNIELFQYAWVGLIVQHVYIIWAYEDMYVRMFTGVYIIADLLYIINSALQHQTSIVTKSILLILGPIENRDE
jgi:hypothetical protein